MFNVMVESQVLLKTSALLTFIILLFSITAWSFLCFDPLCDASSFLLFNFILSNFETILSTLFPALAARRPLVAGRCNSTLPSP